MRDRPPRFGLHCASSSTAFHWPIAEALEVGSAQFAVAASRVQLDTASQATILSAPWFAAVSRQDSRTAWPSPFTLAVTRDGTTMKATAEHECPNAIERMIGQRVQSINGGRARQLWRYRSRTLRHAMDVFTRGDRRVASAARVALDGKRAMMRRSFPRCETSRRCFSTRPPCIPFAVVALLRRERASSRRSEPRNECSTRP